jgi:hypothetical protein
LSSRSLCGRGTEGEGALRHSRESGNPVFVLAFALIEVFIPRYRAGDFSLLVQRKAHQKKRHPAYALRYAKYPALLALSGLRDGPSMARHAGSAPASPAALRRLLPLRAAMLGAAEGDPTSKAKKQRYVAAFFFLFYLFLCFALLTPPFIKPSIAAFDGSGPAGGGPGMARRDAWPRTAIRRAPANARSAGVSQGFMDCQWQSMLANATP